MSNELSAGLQRCSIAKEDGMSDALIGLLIAAVILVGLAMLGRFIRFVRWGMAIDTDEHRAEWGDKVVDMLLKRQMDVGMTSEMVLLSWGKPDTVENIKKTSSGQVIRFVYGKPRQGATYIYLQDNRITRIEGPTER